MYIPALKLLVTACMMRPSQSKCECKKESSNWRRQKQKSRAPKSRTRKSTTAVASKLCISLPPHSFDTQFPYISTMSFMFFGRIFKVSLLIINAMAILNEERFLARRESLQSFFEPC